MRKLLIAIALLLSISQIHARGAAGGNVSVRGYFRGNGTFVQPHMRSDPLRTVSSETIGALTGTLTRAQVNSELS